MDAQSDLVRVTVVDHEIFNGIKVYVKALTELWNVFDFEAVHEQSLYGDSPVHIISPGDYVVIPPETLDRWNKVWDAWRELQDEIESTLVQQQGDRNPAQSNPQ